MNRIISACTKTRNTETPEHQNTPEHRNSQKTQNTELKLTVLSYFSITDHVKK